MKKMVQVLESTIDTEVTLKGALYVEYFDKPGFYYKKDVKPEGLGLPLTADPNHDWVKAGMMKLVDTIPAKESEWWLVSKKFYDDKIDALKQTRDEMAEYIGAMEKELEEITK